VTPSGAQHINNIRPHRSNFVVGSFTHLILFMCRNIQHKICRRKYKMISSYTRLRLAQIKRPWVQILMHTLLQENGRLRLATVRWSFGQAKTFYSIFCCSLIFFAFLICIRVVDLFDHHSFLKKYF
jgi:hypothetical protein